MDRLSRGDKRMQRMLMCTISHHTMVTVQTSIEKRRAGLSTQRKEAWKRTVEEWTNCTDQVWKQVTDARKSLSIHMHWNRWR